jgi:nicotinamidase-related amidase
LAGFTAERCLLFTASDAYMRDYMLFIPEDCTASISPEDAPPAIQWMQKALGADVRPSTEIVWSELTRGPRPERPSPRGA